MLLLYNYLYNQWYNMRENIFGFCDCKFNRNSIFYFLFNNLVQSGKGNADNLEFGYEVSNLIKKNSFMNQTVFLSNDLSFRGVH